jgi:type III pantothenate kinase
MLTVDIGNSRIKWALWKDRRIIGKGACEYTGAKPLQAFSIFDELSPQSPVMVACVAGEAVEHALRDWMQQHWSVSPVFLRTTAELGGVRNAYSNPSQHGVDRWAALVGARHIYRVPVCIIDAGTAITLDLMDAKGRHRGGRILPGLQMMRDALLEGTGGIDQTDGEATVFADNTADAVSSGTLHMLQAALIEICSSAAQLLGNNMKIIITGGMSEQIMSLHGLPELVHEPDLVMLGLRVAAETTMAGN